MNTTYTSNPTTDAQIEAAEAQTVTRATIQKDGTLALWNKRSKISVTEFETSLKAKTVEGVLASLPLPCLAPEALDAFEEGLDRATERCGSVIPDSYRHEYGVDQNCGDGLATTMLAVCGGGNSGPIDMEALEAVASENAIADRFDGWMAKGLNNGMVRMNVSNVLRGKVRRGEAVTIKGQPITTEA